MNAIATNTEASASRCQAALQDAMRLVEPLGPGRWWVRSNGPSKSPVQVHLVDGILTLTGQFSSQTPPSFWDLLKANAKLTGLAKFCFAPNGGLCLRAEIPVQADSDLSLRLQQALRALENALDPSLGCPEGASAPPKEVVPADLPKLVAEAGWQCSSRRGDCCAVLLENRGSAYTALITQQTGAIRVRTELVAWDSLSEPCRAGLATLLMTANARFRLARAIVAEDESGGAAHLEVLFQAPASAAELRCALEALSVGAGLCSPAGNLLLEETGAKFFLAVRGGPRDSENSQ